MHGRMDGWTERRVARTAKQKLQQLLAFPYTYHNLVLNYSRQRARPRQRAKLYTIWQLGTGLQTNRIKMIQK
jgi:hypothetical protein